MGAIYAKTMGHKQIVHKPYTKQAPWLWRYGPLLTASTWICEGLDTPGYSAAAGGTPTPVVGLPGATWNAVEYYTDTNSERNTDHFSLFAWIRPTLIAGADRFILGKYDSGGPLGFRWYIRHTVAQQYAVFQTAGGTIAFTENVTSISLNVWQLVGVTWDPDTGRATFYHNGEVTRTATGLSGSGAISASAVDLRIGVNSALANPFVGSIALPGCLDHCHLDVSDEHARWLFEEERHIFGV